MQKTSNYNLKKPEPTDPLRVEDFNENADIIDAALAGLNTVVGNAGNCKIVTGSYVGTGTYGADNSNSLSFDFVPKLIEVRNGIFAPLQLFAGTATSAFQANTTGETNIQTVSWSADGKTVYWYCPHGPATQLNKQGTEYYYVAWG